MIWCGAPSRRKSCSPMAKSGMEFLTGCLGGDRSGCGPGSCPGPHPSFRVGRPSLVDGEALAVAVVDELVLPVRQPVVQVALVGVGLADGVTEDAVRVDLERQ